ncbi:hypothetical protein XELAEV_18040729mg, partial [Xenopus laevis]
AAVRPIVNFSPNWATIFTSESVTMTCNVDSTAQGDLGYSWYKDGSLIGSGQQKYTIDTAQESHSGEYKCKTRDSDLSEAGKLTVSSELFSKPIISVNSGQIQINEGGHMTITCDTNLSPHRATTELQFVFYRNGHNVQGFSLSNQYGVSSAQLEDSGNYTCEIKDQSGGVKKESDPKSIQIKGQ